MHVRWMQLPVLNCPDVARSLFPVPQVHEAAAKSATHLNRLQVECNALTRQSAQLQHDNRTLALVCALWIRFFFLKKILSHVATHPSCLCVPFTFPPHSQPQLVERSRADLAHVRAQNTRLRGAAHRITEPEHALPSASTAASTSPTRSAHEPKPLSRQPSAADLRRNPRAASANANAARPPLDLASLNASRSFIFGD
jgi:hypothetical protein